ncbi:MAG: cupin domain-containing protein [Solirubrobacteraceae bacterium]
MTFAVVRPDELEWITRPHEPGEPSRQVSELSERAGLGHARANLWRYEPHAKGLRHRHPHQEEIFLVLSGVLSMYVGEPPQRQDVPVGGLIRVSAGTALQAVNHGEEDLLLYIHGYPPEDERAEILASDVQA